MGEMNDEHTGRRWLRIALRALFALGALVLLYVVVTFVQVWTSADGDQPMSADAIVVLGAAQYDGRPSPVLQRRLDLAATLWSEGYADHVVTTGSSQAGDRFTEGYAGFEYLLSEGIPEDQLQVVVDGADTYEQLAATRRLLGDIDDPSVLIVTDPYHALRSRQIASEVGLDARVVTTDGSSSVTSLARETAAVSIGRLLGYRRLSNLGD